MGYKGTLRSINSTLNKMDREAKKRQRDLDRRQKEYEKMQALEQAAYEVDVYENHIDCIQSLHKEASESIDWNIVVNSKAPKKPEKLLINENEALEKLSNFKPNIFHKLFKLTDKKILKLKNNIENGRILDNNIHENEIEEHKQSTEELERNISLGIKLLNNDQEAMIEAIKDFDGFNEIDNLGSKLSFSFNQDNQLIIDIHTHGKEIVPDQIKGLLKSGKLSVKKMPKGTYNEIFQDYVCSATLRVARETFALLPIELATINSIDNMLNKKTGHLEDQYILSLIATRKTINSLNLDLIDPSDAMDNFVHNMNFNKTTGFSAISGISLEASNS